MSKKDTEKEQQNPQPEILEGEQTTCQNEATEQPELSLEQQLETAKADLLLVVADMQNMRKRTDEEISIIRKYGASSLARDLFSVADNLRMALMSITAEEKQNNPTLNNLSLGLDMVAKEFYTAFEKNGIVQILPESGNDFDHNQHQAMGEVDSESVEKGKIAQVLSAGYMLHDRLLKPAMVNIAK